MNLFYRAIVLKILMLINEQEIRREYLVSIKIAWWRRFFHVPQSRPASTFCLEVSTQLMDQAYHYRLAKNTCHLGSGAGGGSRRLACSMISGRALRLAAFLLIPIAAHGALATEAPTAARRGELITLVRQDCGSCHGLTLKGGLGPALLPEALKDKPAASLQATILYGRNGTAMPPWQRFLTEAEAEWIVSQLQKGFPP
ncbi:hypothetical protein BH11PSE12_BH11PSE12_30110 [soil metagenome]